MSGYFLRRFLLIIPTFIGITLAVFVIMHFVPGGPVERQILRFQMAAAGGEGATARRGGVEIPEEAIKEIRGTTGSTSRCTFVTQTGCGTSFASISAIPMSIRIRSGTSSRPDSPFRSRSASRDSC